MSNIQIHQSVTGFFSEKNSKVIDYLNQKLNTKNDIGYIKRATKFTAATLISTVGSIFHAVFAVASLVEAVARHAFAITIKTATFFIPAALSNWIDNKIVTPLFKHAQLTLETAPKAGVRIVTNLLSEKTRQSADSKISLRKLYDSNLFKGFYKLHWTGLSRAAKKVETQSQEKAPTPNDLEGRVTQPEETPTENTQVEPSEEKPTTITSRMKAIQEMVKSAWNKSKEAAKSTGKKFMGLSTGKKAGIVAAATGLAIAIIFYKFGKNPQISLEKPIKENLTHLINETKSNITHPKPNIETNITLTQDDSFAQRVNHFKNITNEICPLRQKVETAKSVAVAFPAIDIFKGTYPFCKIGEEASTKPGFFGEAVSYITTPIVNHPIMSIGIASILFLTYKIKNILLFCWNPGLGLMVDDN